MNKFSAVLPVLACATLATGFSLRAEEATPSPEIALAKLTDEILADDFTFQPLNAVGLGLHQFDGKFVDFSHAAIEAEIQRVRGFKTRLESMDAAQLSAASALDYKLLRLGVDNNLLQLAGVGAYDHNPITYAGALDVNVYLKRNFAPLPDRLRSIVAIERQVPALFAAARENLVEVLPKPFVELALDIAKGNADFLAHDLVDAVKDVKDEALQAEFKTVNDKAAAELTAYADWLTKERLPKADEKSFALGEEKYRQMLAASEAIDLPPAKLLEIGLAELQREQGVFAAAAALINPDKPPIEVFKDIQHDHPTAESLIPDIVKHLENIRRFVVEMNLIDIPSEIRSTVYETPKYLRAGSFASSDNPGPFEVLGAQAYYYVTPGRTDVERPGKGRVADLLQPLHVGRDQHPRGVPRPLRAVAPRQRLADQPRAAHLRFSYAYIEGWAHYCEQMVIDQGYGQTVGGGPKDIEGAKYRLAQSDEALLRGLPSVRFDQAAHAGHERGRGDEVLRGQLLLRRKTLAPGSVARHVRSGATCSTRSASSNCSSCGVITRSRKATRSPSSGSTTPSPTMANRRCVSCAKSCSRTRVQGGRNPFKFQPSK